MGELDTKLGDVQTRVVKIEANMENKATKSQVYMLVAVTAGIAVLSMLGYIELRLL